ncbi:MAG: hypothetical protein JXR77_15850 [Lentisphaeria bacterium]|nr:hypothetical protein [Lentisphaeria bacterium]
MDRVFPLPRLLCALWIAAALLLGASCGRTTPVPEAETTAVTREVVRGPVTVRVTLDRSAMTLADRFALRLEIEFPEDTEVVFPTFGKDIEAFLIRDALTTDPELIGEGRLRQTRTYDLEPVVSGEYTIPAMEVTFGKRGEEEPDAHRVETPELTVTVTSLLPEEVAALDVEDILPPHGLPRPGRRWLWLPGVALVVAGLLTALWIRRIRRGRVGGSAVVLPAHERAYAELRALVAEDLVAKGCVKEFYQGVSGVLRRYIERRFDLHAPERTTEEFLAELGAGETLCSEHQELLRQFLIHCDLVKFAELVPGGEQIQQTFDCCKRFIEQTRADAGANPSGGGEA